LRGKVEPGLLYAAWLEESLEKKRKEIGKERVVTAVCSKSKKCAPRTETIIIGSAENPSRYLSPT
jgi:hypothetical protein